LAAGAAGKAWVFPWDEAGADVRHAADCIYCYKPDKNCHTSASQQGTHFFITIYYKMIKFTLAIAAILA
jgi:hypothetical protein